MQLVIRVNKDQLNKARALPPYTVRMHGGKKVWKTPKGQWVPVPKERQGAKRKPKKGSKMLSNPGDVEHSVRLIKEMYARRPEGQGREMGIASESDLKKILKNTTIALMSAERDNLSNTENKKRNRQLKKDLQQKGFIYTPAKGMYTAPEESIMVMIHDADRQELVDLGNKYNQDSVLFSDKGQNEMIKTTGEDRGAAIMRGQGYITKDPNAKDEDFYTDVKLGSGKTYRFMLNVEDVEKALRLLRS